MTSYTAGRIHLNAHLPPELAPLPEIYEPVGPTRATVLVDIARSVGPARNLKQLDGAWDTVARLLPAHERWLPLLAAQPYHRAVTLTVEARSWVDRDPRQADRVATRASPELREALAAAAVELGRRERGMVASVARRALRRLGYAVRTSEGRRTTAVEGRLDHHVVVVAVGDAGGVEVDHVGIAETGCLELQRVLEEAMTALGVELRDTHRTRHDGRTGGGLIASAARNPGASLARAVVLERERAVGS